MKRIVTMLLALLLLSSMLPAWAASDIELYDYFATDPVPQIYIETENGIALNDSSLRARDGFNSYNYVSASISVRDCEGYEFEDVSAQVKVRGNFTAMYPKYPIRIKFDNKQAMCGLNDGNAIKSWVLLAEYVDSTLLHNSAAFYIANSLYSTTGNYCSDFRNVEVYINGEYFGLYVLVEQQQVNKYRIDIPQPEDPADFDTASMTEEELAALKDPHTGYFFEYDGYYSNEDPSITFSIRYDEVTRPNGETFLPTSAGNVRRDSSGEASGESSRRGSGWGGWGRGGNGDTRETGFTIKSDIYYEEQNAFIKNTVQTIWDVLYDTVYTDHSDLTENPYHTMDADGNYIEAPGITSAYEAVASVVDIDSLVDMYIVQEIAADFDLAWSSRFFYIDMTPEGDHKLVYTAPWDFDNAFSSRSSGLYVMNYDNPWFVLFYNQDWFWELVNERWDEAMEAGVFTGVIEMLDTVTEVNADAYDRNSERWSSQRGWGGWGNSSRSGSGEASGESVSAHVRAEQSLRSWLESKINTVDRLLNEMVGETTASAE